MPRLNRPRSRSSDVLEFAVGRDEDHRAGRLVDLAALDADQSVLDDVEPADALRAAPTVQLDDCFQNSDFRAVDAHRDTLVEADDDLIGGVPVQCRVFGVVVDVLGWGVPQVLQEAGLHGAAPDVLVDREGRALTDVDRDGVLLGEGDGLLPGPCVVAHGGRAPRDPVRARRIRPGK